ncbi:MAG: hypothetical protein AAF697_13065 [Pseudomonadota bacterium]
MSGTIIPFPSRRITRGDVRTIDVMRAPDDRIQVQECSAGLGSCGIIAEFGPDERDRAIAYALSMLPQYAPCEIGEIDL